MTATMRAVELPAVGDHFRETTRPVPEPPPGEVRVRVEACGVCGSDVFLQKGGFGDKVTYPVIPGHEAAGIVDALGDGVDGLRARRPGRALLHHASRTAIRGRLAGDRTSRPTSRAWASTWTARSRSTSCARRPR